MTQDELKKSAALAALKYIQPGAIVGVGTGSTTAYFIDALGSIKHKIEGAVSSSTSSSAKLKSLGIPLFDLNDVDSVEIYVDGADEINSSIQMIKGGGGALTREKIISAAARKFICIADISKLVDVLGTTVPLPIEVIPLAKTWVERELVRLGARPIYRQGVVTENGNIILDIHDLFILDAVALEEKINNITGVVTVGLFARRAADVALIGSEQSLKIIE
ncbi:MAG: ribose-5-phosphate isomerase RpiA [Sodalis sp. (in: enterobacteria)]